MASPKHRSRRWFNRGAENTPPRPDPREEPPPESEEDLQPKDPSEMPLELQDPVKPPEPAT
jgi:hypothetical protein